MSVDRFATLDDRAEFWGANTVRIVRRVDSTTNLCSRSVRSVRFVHLAYASYICGARQCYSLFRNSNDKIQSVYGPLKTDPSSPCSLSTISEKETSDESQSHDLSSRGEH